MASVLDNYITIGEESSYGTWAAPTRGYEADADGWQGQSTLLDHAGLRAGRHTTLASRQRRQPQGSVGRIASPVLTGGEGLRLKHLLGSHSGPAANKQTIATTDDGPAGSYSVAVGRVDNAGTLRHFRYPGAVPTDFALSADVNSPLLLDIGYAAADPLINQAAVAPAYPADTQMFTWADVAISVAGASIGFATAFSLNGDLAMNTDRYTLRDNAARLRPTRQGSPIFTGSITGELDGLAELIREAAGNAFTIVMTASYPTAISGVSPALKVTLQSCRYSAATATMAPDSQSTTELPFSVSWDGDNPAVQIEYTAHGGV